MASINGGHEGVPGAIEPAPCEHERAIYRALSCPMLPAPPPVKGLAPPTHAPYSRDLIPGPCDGEPDLDSARPLESARQRQRLDGNVRDGADG